MKGGDDKSMDFEVLYNTYYMQVFSFVMTLTKNRDEAEEITQESFSRAMISGKGYRKESNELTWLCTIAKNFFIDSERKKKHIQTLPDSDEMGISHTEALEIAAAESNEANLVGGSTKPVEEQVEDADSSYRIHMVLHTLEEPYKEVFSLRVFGELSFENIGKIFGKSENWARVTYHRARLKIQEKM